MGALSCQASAIGLTYPLILERFMAEPAMIPVAAGHYAAFRGPNNQDHYAPLLGVCKRMDGTLTGVTYRDNELVYCDKEPSFAYYDTTYTNLTPVTGLYAVYSRIPQEGVGEFYKPVIALAIAPNGPVVGLVSHGPDGLERACGSCANFKEYITEQEYQYRNTP